MHYKLGEQNQDCTNVLLVWGLFSESKQSYSKILFKYILALTAYVLQV